MKTRRPLQWHNSEKSANSVLAKLPRIKLDRIGKMPRGWKPSPPVEEVLLNKARESKETCIKFVRVLLRPELRVFFRLGDKGEESQISDRNLLKTLRVARQLSWGNDKWRGIQESLSVLLAGDWRTRLTARDARIAITVLGNLGESFQFDVTPLQTELNEIALHWAKNSRKPHAREKGRKITEKNQQLLAAMELLTKIRGETLDKASERITELICKANEKSPTAESIQRNYKRHRNDAPYYLAHALHALAPYLVAAIDR